MNNLLYPLRGGKMRKTILYIFVLLLLITAVSALKTIDGDEVSIKEEVNENLFVTGGDITVDAPVKGDLLAFGGNININFPVEEDTHVYGGNILINSVLNGDLMTVGGNIRIKDDVSGDIRSMGGTVEIEGNVGGDIQAVGGNILINGDNVGGDISVLGGALTVDSDVNGNIEFEGGDITIKGVVNGNVTVKVDNIKLSEDALIKGNLHYTSESEPEFNEEQVEGSIEKGVVIKKSSSPFQGIVGKIIGAIALLVISIVIVLIFPTASNNLAENIKKHFWKSLLFGFIVLVVVPIASIIIAITVIGLPVALVLLVLYLLALYLSKIFAALWVGKLVLRKQKSLILPMIIGIVIYVILVSIPFGGWIGFIAILLGLGAMTLMIFGKKKKKK